MRKICVIGSMNIDVVTSVDRFPTVGETVPARTFDIFTGGGKGGNQAVALGKLGADVRMVGRLGDKFYGPDYVKVLIDNQVKADTVEVVPDAFPGTAIVAVDGNSDNILFAYPGTNGMVDAPYLAAHWDKIKDCDFFLFQLEIPLQTNLYAVEALRHLNKTIILDPAPARPLPAEIYKGVDYLTPNETELMTLSQKPVDTDAQMRTAGEVLLRQGVRTVIAKAGKRGAYIITEDEFIHVPGYAVKAIDPTAAGDSFNAGLAYSLAQGRTLYDSVRFANAVGALSTTALGAQSAMPTQSQVMDFIRDLQ